MSPWVGPSLTICPCVSEPDFSRDELIEQIRAAVDPSGEYAALLDALDAADSWRGLTILFPPAVVSELRALLVQHRQFQESTSMRCPTSFLWGGRHST